MKYTERVELVTGLIFIAIVLYMPGGALHIFNLIKARWSGKAQTAKEG
jgi:branched-chain amino acid transport system permease protein